MKTTPLFISSPWSCLFILLCLYNNYLHTHFVSSQCLDDQKSLLLEFKNSLTIDLELGYSNNLLGWNQTTDCCDWSGVECDKPRRRVIGLDLHMNGITGGIDNSSSLFRFRFLRRLDLSYNNIKGSIPSLIGNLTQLEELNLSSNQFFGPLPSFSLMKKLKSLDISNNNVIGTITSTNWRRLVNLVTIDLSLNSLDGNIPSSLLSLPSIKVIYLARNNFSGQLKEFPTPLNGFTSKLNDLDLSHNSLEGSIPRSLFQLRNLTILYMSNNSFEGSIPKSIFQLSELKALDLSSNRFNGTLSLARILQSFKNLEYLVLSDNNYLLVDGLDCHVNSTLPQLGFLRLSSCNLNVIPKCLQNQSSILEIDLSRNQISGVVPSWVWEMRRGNLNDLVYGIKLNLSYNHLVHLEPPVSLLNLSLGVYVLDLHSNNLQGQFPIVAPYLHYLDCSNNNFTSIDSNFGNYLSSLSTLSFSRNNLHGQIPTFLCNTTSLTLLNLEHNHLDGTIPNCLINNMSQLTMLKLRDNNLNGEIHDEFQESCNLQTLDLNGNFLEGKIPQSLTNCIDLYVLDVGNNQLDDTFPCHLQTLMQLVVLVLRSNKLHGTIFCPNRISSLWPMLQIIDLASNHFNGELTTQIFFNKTSMVARTTQMVTTPLGDEFGTGFMDGRSNYLDTVTITFKGNTYDLQYILATFTSIDFSNNNFHGEIPKELGNLNALKVLNFSHNFLSGNIPLVIGNMTQIESLDFSYNALKGNIPSQLGNLNFLEYLNLSYNKLSGKIPTSTQLQSFTASSYEGNQGLYGPPLTAITRSERNPRTSSSSSSEGSRWSSKSELEWMLRGSQVGFPVGLIVFLGPLLYIKRYREWYCKHLHKFAMKIMCKEDGARGRNRGR